MLFLLTRIWSAQKWKLESTKFGLRCVLDHLDIVRRYLEIEVLKFSPEYVEIDWGGEMSCYLRLILSFLGVAWASIASHFFASFSLQLFKHNRYIDLFSSLRLTPLTWTHFAGTKSRYYLCHYSGCDPWLNDLDFLYRPFIAKLKLLHHAHYTTKESSHGLSFHWPVISKFCIHSIISN
jgi:hypothetical protein